MTRVSMSSGHSGRQPGTGYTGQDGGFLRPPSRIGCFHFDPYAIRIFLMMFHADEKCRQTDADYQKR